MQEIKILASHCDLLSRNEVSEDEIIETLDFTCKTLEVLKEYLESKRLNDVSFNSKSR